MTVWIGSGERSCSVNCRPPFRRCLDAHADDVLRFRVASVGDHDADDAFQ